MITNPTILSMALLKVNWDYSRKDYLENFVPIVAECIRLSQEDVVSLPDLQQQLLTRFGLRFPQNAIRVILRRVGKQGYIRSENRVYMRNPGKLARLQFHDAQQRVLQMHGALIRELVLFCQDESSITWSAEEGEAALQSYLEENQPLVATRAGQSTLIPQSGIPNKSVRFLIGSFIRHLQETHSASFEYLDTIIKGNMLANAVFLTEPGQHQRRFRNTEIYFDTSLLIFSLGYAGKPREAPCIELLELLYETGAQLRCFAHTLDEVRGALDACAYLMAEGRLRDAYGPSIEYFLSQGFTASDVELRSARLERDLEGLRIRIVDKPPYTPHKYVIDEKKLTATLQERIEYSNPNAVARDVDSISAVMRLRRGRQPSILEESGALFVTTNSSLAYESRNFCCEDAPPSVVSPCVTDYALTNLLWLKKPLEAPDLPRKRIIADCYAATQPDATLWGRYLKEIDKLEKEGRISPDDYYMLRHSLYAKTELMRLTLGEPEAFVQATVPEILEYLESRSQAGLKLELARETLRRETAEQEIETRQARETERVSRIRARGQKYAVIVAKVIEYGALVLLVIGTVSTFPWRFPPPSSKRIMLFLVSILQFFMLVLSVLNLMYGTALRSLVRRLEIALSRWFVKQLMALAEIE